MSHPCSTDHNCSRVAHNPVPDPTLVPPCDSFPLDVQRSSHRREVSIARLSHTSQRFNSHQKYPLLHIFRAYRMFYHGNWASSCSITSDIHLLANRRDSWRTLLPIYLQNYSIRAIPAPLNHYPIPRPSSDRPRHHRTVFNDFSHSSLAAQPAPKHRLNFAKRAQSC